MASDEIVFKLKILISAHTDKLMMIPSILIHIPLYHSDKNTIGIAGGILVTIQCILMIASIYPTERALKKHFNEDGTRI